MPINESNIERIGGTNQSGADVIDVANSAVRVTAASLPLPTGAATDATLTTINTSVSTLDTDLKSTQADANEARFRLQIRSQAQTAEIFAASPQNGFSPMTEVPSFLGGF